jgi:putative endonuclease
VGRKFVPIYRDTWGAKKRGLPPLFFFAAMFYIYILYSDRADKYYIGHTCDIFRRLEEHNSAEKNSFTSHYRPWILKASFTISESRREARKVENYIKNMKNRKFIERLIEHTEEFEEILAGVGVVAKDTFNWMLLGN